MHPALARLCTELTKRREFLPTCVQIAHWMRQHEHWAHTHLHTVYFGFVAFEAHGHYGTVAGLLFILSIVGTISGEALE